MENEMEKILFIVLIISVVLLSCRENIQEKIIFSNVDYLRLRYEPSLDSDIIRLLMKGEELQILEIGKEVTIDNIKSNWVKVRTKEQQIGWCFGAYLSKKYREEEKNTVENINLEDLCNHPFVDYKMLPEQNYDLNIIKKEYGEPKQIKTREIRNMHNDSIDKIIRIDYNSFYFEYYYITLYDEYFLTTIGIINNDIKLRYGLKIGLSSIKIKVFFGKPNYIHEYKDGSIQYSYSLNPENDGKGVSFIFHEDKVKRIIFSNNLD